MPKETFLNLSKDKRCLIEDVAINEFAEYGFETASINRIVKAAGIAKGSYYQYFEDKVDLFMHIIDVVGQKKIEYISPAMANPADHDFYTLLEELYRSALAFAKDHPRESIIGFEIYKNKTSPIFNAIMQESRRMASEFYSSLLDMGIQRGEVDSEIDKSFTSHILIQFQLSMLDYYLETNDGAEWDSDIMPTVRLMISFIKNGIQPPK